MKRLDPLWLILAAALVVATVLALSACHAPRPGYGTPRVSAVRR